MKLRMLDRITFWEPWRRIRGVKSVSFEEYRLKSRLGETPQLPQSLVLQSLLELGNWLVMKSSDFALMTQAVEFEEACFRRVVRPGLTRQGHAPDQMQNNHGAAVATLDLADLRLGPDRQAGLLAGLPDRRLPCGLIGFEFTAGEFPKAGENPSLGPPAY